MKDFALDEFGDIVVKSNDIAWVRDKQQEIQKIRQVLGTRLGEWIYDTAEGIDMEALLQKHPDLNRIQETIQNGLLQINETYILQECSYSAENHVLRIKVSAQAQEPMEIYLTIGEG